MQRVNKIRNARSKRNVQSKARLFNPEGQGTQEQEKREAHLHLPLYSICSLNNYLNGNLIY